MLVDNDVFVITTSREDWFLELFLKTLYVCTYRSFFSLVSAESNEKTNSLHRPAV